MKGKFIASLRFGLALMFCWKKCIHLRIRLTPFISLLRVEIHNDFHSRLQFRVLQIFSSVDAIQFMNIGQMV